MRSSLAATARFVQMSLRCIAVATALHRLSLNVCAREKRMPGVGGDAA